MSVKPAREKLNEWKKEMSYSARCRDQFSAIIRVRSTGRKKFDTLLASLEISLEQNVKTGKMGVRNCILLGEEHGEEML